MRSIPVLGLSYVACMRFWLPVGANPSVISIRCSASGQQWYAVACCGKLKPFTVQKADPCNNE
jgi:hypothetical protein